ncbi:hypothetical protein [Nonomuraea sp. SYSU D8015]|uniref:hypothetical protein n=1 Tax=Nonomuraea sp. SYSU D8015 TaxID=2593644 RepID=UPI0016613AB4|nr:hypothetical protein [Nonomuraea sp. SYSU D8015]
MTALDTRPGTGAGLTVHNSGTELIVRDCTDGAAHGAAALRLPRRRRRRRKAGRGQESPLLQGSCRAATQDRPA